MKEGAYIGAIVAFFIYMFLPIYGDNGMPANIIPTANAVSTTESFNVYVTNLPFSTIVFFALEIMGVSLGIVSQMVLKNIQKQKQNI